MSQALGMSMTSGGLKSDGGKARKLLYGANMLKHVLKRGGREGAELKVDDLDEDVLQARWVKRVKGMRAIEKKMRERERDVDQVSFGCEK